MEQSKEGALDREVFMAPRDPAWNEPTEAQLATFRERLRATVAALADELSVRDTSRGGADEDLPVRSTPDWQLAMLRALRIARDEAEPMAEPYARGAGAGGVNYPQLGDAWGISRQAARKKWPGAVINPHANREPHEVEAFGGHARVTWHPEDGGWWWIAQAANGRHQDAGDDLTYDTSEEALAHAGAFLAANTATDGEAK
ncbi:hypothetical protein ACIRO1_45365 [Streptomyces sp. NPDC102381]|jgi:hypothetical protein|uniref:hypothetical protein n=1 Tax=Streptomyces sp. NPDC102381 TaxID=3366164 RepID=UPI0038293D7A